MFIKCEKCSRIYEVADEKLQTLSPRFFKCTACGAVFDAPFVQKEPDVLPQIDEAIKETEMPKNVMPLADVFAPQPEDESDFSKALEAPFSDEALEKPDALFDVIDKDSVFEPVKSKTFHLPRWLFGVFAFILTFVSVFYLFYVGRFYFVRKVPFTEKVYEKAGISTNITGEGLAFEDTLFELSPNSNQNTLSVKSYLVNTMGTTKPVPSIVILLKDEKGIELQREYVLITESEIKAGEKIAFESHLTDIHPNAAKIEITFEGAFK